MAAVRAKVARYRGSQTKRLRRRGFLSIVISCGGAYTGGVKVPPVAPA